LQSDSVIEAIQKVVGKDTVPPFRGQGVRREQSGVGITSICYICGLFAGMAG
jgi:hypothetical protein